MSSTGVHDRDMSKELAHSNNGPEGQLQSTRITFGAGAIYFARAPTEWKWNELPKGLNNEIDEGTKRKGSTYLPRLLAFGLKNALFARWGDGCKYDLKGQYNGLEEHFTTGSSTRNVEVSPSTSNLIHPAIAHFQRPKPLVLSRQADDGSFP